MNTGARWLADERTGRHDLGERQTAQDASLRQRGGDPTIAAPRTYPLLDRLDEASWREWMAVMADAGLVSTPEA